MDTFAEEKSKSIEILLKARELNTLYSIKQLIDSKLNSTIGEGDWADGYIIGLDAVKDEILKLIKQLKEE